MATRKNYIYGDGSRSTVRIVLDAAISLDLPASQAEIYARVLQDISNFAEANMFPDLSSLTVNCRSRSNYSGNKSPRRTDEGHPLDQLYRLRLEKKSLYVKYDPLLHGVWALTPDEKGKLRPTLTVSPSDLERKLAQEDVDACTDWIGLEDARRQIMALIVRREGQPAFRRELLMEYGGACSISGCTVAALLEAAHIVPYRGEHTNLASNGLLLRADIHKLFDLHLLYIDPETRQVNLHHSLRDSEYSQFSGRTLRMPVNPTSLPLSEALRHHAELCIWEA